MSWVGRLLPPTENSSKLAPAVVAHASEATNTVSPDAGTEVLTKVGTTVGSIPAVQAALSAAMGISGRARRMKLKVILGLHATPALSKASSGRGVE